MRCTRTFVGLSMACAMASVSPSNAVSLQEGAAEPAPSAIEEALIERDCGPMHPAGSLETPAYLECRRTQLLSLRNDFGRDLRRLSAAQRRTIDAACSDLRESQGQDAYVACLSSRLMALRPHASGARVDAASNLSPASSATPAIAPTLPLASSAASRWWIAPVLLTLVAAAAGGAVVIVRARRRPGTCRTCGVKLLEQGELCQTCRHEAAEARRRASAERADEERAREEDQRRQTAREEEQRQQRAADEAARLVQEEEAEQQLVRQREEEAELRRHDETRRQQASGADASEEDFDPYAVLGLPRDSSAEDINAAYTTARAKYDMDLVADMGSELQEHFKRKALAVERAYQALTKIATVLLVGFAGVLGRW